MLLASCDRRTLVGRRDFAVLLLLSRLGLRAGEVAAVRLDDIEWRAGLLLVRGKGSRQDVLPLPVDVGEAIVSCLRRRPRCEYRALFLRVMASREGLNRCTVAWVVRAACDREPPRQPGATGTVAPSGMPANSPVSDPVVVISVYVSPAEKIGQEAGGTSFRLALPRSIGPVALILGGHVTSGESERSDGAAAVYVQRGAAIDDDRHRWTLDTPG